MEPGRENPCAARAVFDGDAVRLVPARGPPVRRRFTRRSHPAAIPPWTAALPPPAGASPPWPAVSPVRPLPAGPASPFRPAPPGTGHDPPPPARRTAPARPRPTGAHRARTAFRPWAAGGPVPSERSPVRPQAGVGAADGFRPGHGGRLPVRSRRTVSGPVVGRRGPRGRSRPGPGAGLPETVAGLLEAVSPSRLPGVLRPVGVARDDAPPVRGRPARSRPAGRPPLRAGLGGPGPRQSGLRSAASRTMSTRDRIPSFRYTRVRVASTVLTLMNRRPAISRLVAPSMTRAAT